MIVSVEMNPIVRIFILYVYLGIPVIASIYAEKLDYSNSGLTSVPTAPALRVTELDLSWNLIEELDSHSFTNYSELSTLDVSFNSLRAIHDGTFDTMQKLLLLRLAANKIMKLPSDFGPSTTTLSTIGANTGFDNPDILTYPYFGAFSGLERITIGATHMKLHNGSIFPPSAKYLYLVGLDIYTFPQLSMYTPMVDVIRIGQNNIASVPQEYIKNLTLLRVFDAMDNKIIYFPNFSHCFKLEEIILSRNMITSVPRDHVVGLVSIIHIDLMINSITMMPDVSSLTTLETINIGLNQIAEIPERYISGLINLKVLDCQSNNISVLPNISRLFPQLEELYVQGNCLTTLPDLYDMSPQFRFYAADNPYVCNQSLCWLRMLHWMRPHVKMLQDHATCEEHRDDAGTLVARYHPASMECYRGMDVMFV